MNRLEQNKDTNKLIAKFLEMETIQRGRNGWEECIFSFHHSWDSLMLAVEKCYNTKGSYELHKNIEDCFIYNIEDRLKGVYEAVIEFIIEYNKENK